MAASQLPDETKGLVAQSVRKAYVSAGFLGCADKKYIAPVLRVEANLPPANYYDKASLEERSRRESEIMVAVKAFAQTFRPGYFVKEEGKFGGWEKYWVADDEGGATCTGSVEFWGAGRSSLSMLTKYNQSENRPVK
ncbi:hypothetical protein ACWGE1_21180 [Streptomyces sp. NPDC054932]